MTEGVQLKAGTRLRSAVCETQVVVVKAPAEPVSIECGGRPMLPHDDPAPLEAMAGDAGEGTKLGKRYADEELGLELLCTKPGAGDLTVNGNPLGLKGAKPLPSSD